MSATSIALTDYWKNLSIPATGTTASGSNFPAVTNSTGVTTGALTIPLSDLGIPAGTTDIRTVFLALCNAMWKAANYTPTSATSNPVGNTSSSRPAADSTNVSTDTTRLSNQMRATISSGIGGTTANPIVTQIFTFSFNESPATLPVATE